jgi:tape measure domain-containing protein
MVAQVGALRVTVGADITGLQTGMAKAQRQVAQSAGAMKRSVGDLQLTFKEIATFSSRAFRTGALAFAGVFGARTILGVADASKNLAAQLRLATSQYGSFAQANKDVQAIAERSRSDLLSTAELYAALMRNADQFGASQSQVARITETVAKAFKISGASADEASNATRQLVQAFQSGRLQGDEFRSMMENAPRLARLLADSLGKTVGELRNMSKEGTLTADVLARAFSDKRFTATIDDEFKALPVTFDQAMGQVYNAAVIVFGEFDSGGQFSTAIANFVTGGTGGFAKMGDAAYNFGAQVRGVLDSLDAFRDAIGSLHTEGVGALLGLNDASITLNDTLTVILGTVQGMMNAFANLYNAPGNLIRLATGGKAITNPVDLLGPYNKAKTDAARRRITGVSAADMLSEFGFSKAPPPFHPSAGGKKKKGKKPPRDRSADTEYQFENELRQAQRDILQAQQDMAHTDDDRSEIALQLLDLDKEQQNAELDERVRKAKRDEAEGKITAGALAQVEAQAQVLRGKYEEADELKRRKIIDDRAHKQVEDNVHLSDVELDLKQDALKDQLDLATTASERRDIELRLLDLAYRQERARLEAVLADEQASDAAKQEALMRLRSLDDRFAAQRQGVINSTRNPLEAWAASVPQTAAQITEALQGIEANALDGIADAISGIISGTQSMADAFRDMAQSIIADIIKMTVKMLIFQAISGLLNKGSTSIIPLQGGVMSITDVPHRATGGPVVPGRTYMVGERGPELVRFGASGQVIPNHALGGGGSFVVNQYNNFAGGAVTRDDLARMHSVTVAAAKSAVAEERRRAG